VSWRSFVFVGSFFLRGLIRLRTMGEVLGITRWSL
jgi:hypothetical protein